MNDDKKRKLSEEMWKSLEDYVLGLAPSEEYETHCEECFAPVKLGNLASWVRAMREVDK